MKIKIRTFDAFQRVIEEAFDDGTNYVDLNIVLEDDKCLKAMLEGSVIQPIRMAFSRIPGGKPEYYAEYLRTKEERLKFKYRQTLKEIFRRQ